MRDSWSLRRKKARGVKSTDPRGSAKLRRRSPAGGQPGTQWWKYAAAAAVGGIAYDHRSITSLGPATDRPGTRTTQSAAAQPYRLDRRAHADTASTSGTNRRPGRSLGFQRGAADVLATCPRQPAGNVIMQARRMASSTSSTRPGKMISGEPFVYTLGAIDRHGHDVRSNRGARYRNTPGSRRRRSWRAHWPDAFNRCQLVYYPRRRQSRFRK